MVQKTACSHIECLHNIGPFLGREEGTCMCKFSLRQFEAKGGDPDSHYNEKCLLFIECKKEW